MRTRFCLVAWLAFVPGAILAQQELPAPAPAPAGVTPIVPPPRVPPLNPPQAVPPQSGLLGRQPIAPGERRERLRSLGGQLLNSIVAPQPGAGGGGAPLNVGRLNEMIPAILGPLVSADTAIESMSLTFNPAVTNLALDTIGLSADVILRRTAWSSTPTHLHIDLTAQANMSQPGGAMATVEIRLVLQTPVVPLADFAIQKYKAKQPVAMNSAANTAIVTSDDLFKARLTEKLNRIVQFNSFDDLMDLYQSVASLRFLSVNEQVEQLKAAQASAANEPARQALAAQLVAARQQRDGLANVRSQIQRDPYGQARAILVVVNGVDSGAAATVDKAEIAVSEAEITVVATARVTKGVEVYALLKPLVMMTLDRLAQGDPATIEQQRGLLQGFWGRSRPLIINGQP